MKWLKLAGMFLFLVALVVGYACKAPPDNPVAPEGSTIYLTANPLTIPALNGISTVTALIFEPNGVPVEDNKKVIFSTTLGTIESEVLTQGGQAIAHLRSTGETGSASVTALKIVNASATGSRPRCRMRSASVCPSTYSMMMQGRPSYSKKS